MLKTLVIAASATLIGVVGAAAQTSTTPSTSGSSPSAGKQMTQAECTSAWTLANPTKSTSLSQAQAKAYVTDFSGADSNKDGNLSQAEFLAACQQGKVSNAASTGAGGGTSGSSTSGASSGMGGSTGKAK